VTCELPPFGRDEARLRAYYLPLRDCLDTAWHTALDSAGMPWSSPSVNLSDHPGAAFCGDFEDTDFTAAYCHDSETIFVPVGRLTKVDRGGSAVHLGVFAHEYGHHVQASVGILEAAFQREDRVGPDSPQGQELSRRVELQVDCFAGLFLAAAAGRGDISRRLADSAVNSFRLGALAKTHGPGSRQHTWARRGYEGKTTAACNTWAAPVAEVS
jgi:predicted metalloprotease